jgi:hypothetical protein
MAMPFMALVDDTSSRHMQAGEMRVRISKTERYRSLGLGPTSARFANVVLEASRQVDPGAVFVAGHRIEDRFTACFNQSRHVHARRAGIDIDLELDIREYGIMDLLEGSRENLKEGRARFGVLACHDAQQSLPLLIRRALVNNRDDFSPAFVNSARPLQDHTDLQTIELRVAMSAFVDLNESDGAATSLGWACSKLAGTTVGAAAVYELSAFDNPFRVGHDLLLFLAAAI